MTALCTAVVGDVRVGVDAARVRELVRGREVTAIPLAGPAVRGLVNLRGDLVTVIDMRARLGRAPHPEPERGVHMVLRDAPVRSLLVDAVGDVLEADPSTLLDTPANIDPAVRPLVRAAALRADDLILVLDVQRVAALADCLGDAVRPREESRR